MPTLKWLSMIILALLILFGMEQAIAENQLALDDDTLRGPMRGGQVVDVRWVSERREDLFVVGEYSVDGGASWVDVGKKVRDKDGHLIWKVPFDVDSAQCLFRLIQQDKDGQEVSQSQLQTPFLIDSTAPTIKPLGPQINQQRYTKIEYSCDDNDGGSGVDTVRLYYRLENTKLWQSTREDVDAKTPYPIEFPHRGRWELFLVARDAVGNQTKQPKISDQAQLVVDIQSGEPLVKLFPLKPNYLFGENGELTIRWKAEDDDLGEKPISLFYRQSSGIWNPIAQNIANTGQWTWKLPNQDLRLDMIKIEVVDEQNHRNSDQKRCLVQIDVQPPETTLLGPRDHIPTLTEKPRPFRLEHKLDDGFGSGVDSLILFWRQQGEKQWIEKKLKLRSVYEKITFEEEDGRYELVLVAIDKAGNREAVPTERTTPELSVLIDRKEPEVFISSVKKEGDSLVVSWQAHDANFGTVPVSVYWPGGQKRALPAQGSHSIPISSQEITIEVKAIDLAGRSKMARKVWRSDQEVPPEIVETKEPVIAFKTQGVTVARGQEQKLVWSVQDVSGLKATLFRSEQIIETREIDPNIQELTWVIDGGHLQEDYWVFEAGQQKWESPRWLVDDQSPDFKIKAQLTTQPDKVDVMVEVTDTPAGVDEAYLWFSQDAGQRWQSRSLKSGKNNVQLTVQPGELYLRVSASDVLGNIRRRPEAGTSPDEKIFVVQPLQERLVFDIDDGHVFKKGQSHTIRWTSKDLKSLKATLYRNNQLVESRELNPLANQLDWEISGNHLDEEYWVLSTPANKWQTKTYVVDAQAPTVDISAPQSIDTTKLTGQVVVKDQPAGVREAKLWFSEDQGQSWNHQVLQGGVNEFQYDVQSTVVWLRVSAEDSLGNERQAPRSGSPADYIVNVIQALDPHVAFLTQGGIIGPGEQVLSWDAQDVDQMTAELFKNASEVIKSVKVDKQTRQLAWQPQGNHLDTFQWIFHGEGKRFSSRVWQLDAQAPKGQLEAPELIEKGKKDFIVKVLLEDPLSGVKKADLWVSEHADWKTMDSIALDPNRHEQEVVIPFSGKKLYITLSAEDKVGNHLQDRSDWPLAIVDAKKQKPYVAFTELDQDQILPGGALFQLKWTAKNIEDALTLEELQPTGQWNHVADIPSHLREYSLKLPQEDRQSIRWRLKQGEQVLAQTMKLIQVDATPPQILISVPERSSPTFEVKVRVRDSGPAGYNDGILWGRRQGDIQWEQLGIFDKDSVFSLSKKPGTWEFTASILDRFGRGQLKPEVNSPAMAKTVIDDPVVMPTQMHLALIDPGKTLYLGGSKINFNVTLSDQNQSQAAVKQEILIKDQQGQVLGVLKDQGNFSIVAPRESVKDWRVHAQYGQLVSNPIQLNIDLSNPQGALKLKEPLQKGQWAKVEVMAWDEGPAGVETFELYRSDDGGVNWVLVAGARTDMEFAPQDHRVKLFLRVKDRIGLWSRGEPGPHSLEDLLLDWQSDPHDFGFDTFVDAGLYRGGDIREVKWHGLKQDAELQYMPGPGMPWIPLADLKAGQTSYRWQLPLENTRGVELRIVGSSGVVLMKVPTSFAIDSTPSKSRLSFLPSDVVETAPDYTRERAHIKPRHPPRGELTDPVGPRQIISTQKPKRIDGVDSVDPFDFASYAAAARDAFNKKDYGKAARYLESAHRIQDSVAETHDMLAQCYQKMNRKEGMIVEQLHKSLDLNSNNARAWNHLGVLARLRDDKELAREYFEKALKVEPIAQTFLNLGIMEHEDGRVITARDHFKKVRQSLRYDHKRGAYKEATWRLTMIYTYSALKDFAEARRFWAQVLELFGRESWQGKRARKWLSEHDTSF